MRARRRHGALRQHGARGGENADGNSHRHGSLSSARRPEPRSISGLALPAFPAAMRPAAPAARAAAVRRHAGQRRAHAIDQSAAVRRRHRKLPAPRTALKNLLRHQGLIRRWNSGIDPQLLEGRIGCRFELPLFRLARDGERQPFQRALRVARRGVTPRELIHRLFAPRVDLERLLGFFNRLGVLAFLRQLRRARQQPVRHARGHHQQAAQLVERLLVIVDANVDDAFDGVFGIRRQRAHHQDAGRLHAARIAALRLAGVERIHQPLGHRALAVLIRRGHGLDHLFARQRVALRGEVGTRDVSGVAAEVHEVLGIGIAVDHALAGVDGGPALRVDHRHLPGVAAGIFVGDPLDDLRGRQSLLEQGDGLRTV